MRHSTGILLLVVLMVCSDAVGMVFYVDPARGKTDGYGTAASPWKTLSEVTSRGRMRKVKAGDTVLLRSGFHGEVTLSGKNSELITIAAEKGHRPTLSRLEITSGTRWRLYGLTVSPSLADKPYEGSIITFAEVGDSGEIVVENCFVYTAEDSSGWDVAKWMKANNGITMGRNGKGHVLRNNYILNTRFAVNLCAEDSLCEGNVITNFSADGIQCFLFNKGSGTLRRATVVGNIIINREDDRQKYPNHLQAIGFFDGPLIDFVVTDNVVLVDMWHGVSLYDAHSARIERNVAWTRWGGSSRIRPWIQLGGSCQNCIVRNNYACSYRIDQPGTVKENNGRSTEQICTETMTRIHKTICEKFGTYHPVAGYARLGMTKGRNTPRATNDDPGQDKTEKKPAETGDKPTP